MAKKKQKRLRIMPWIIIFAVAGASFAGYAYIKHKDLFLETETAEPTLQPIQSTEPMEQIPLALEGELPEKIDLDVPFLSQAPFGEWDDPRQQDACEEASIIMAAFWLNNEKIDKDTGKATILKMAAYQEEKFGYSRDTSAADTFKILQDYFGYADGELIYDIDINDIRAQLAAGRPVVIMANGKKLNNPYFSGGGPERHALIIKGYNDKKGYFITNDPGTRQGADFEYSYETIADSLRDYESGYHEPITENRTAMIVIHPTSTPLNLNGNVDTASAESN